MNTTLIELPLLRLISAKSNQFPEGNSEAFASLESHLDSLTGRKFYGVLFQAKDGLDYFAGLLPNDETEERRFGDLGFPILEIEGGPCVRTKLYDWSSQTDQIGQLFGKMIDQFGIDPTRPQIEFYRSQQELHLILPVQDTPGAAS